MTMTLTSPAFTRAARSPRDTPAKGTISRRHWPGRRRPRDQSLALIVDDPDGRIRRRRR